MQFILRSIIEKITTGEKIYIYRRRRPALLYSSSKETGQNTEDTRIEFEITFCFLAVDYITLGTKDKSFQKPI